MRDVKEKGHAVSQWQSWAEQAHTFVGRILQRIVDIPLMLKATEN
jgi:hypothetical protein